MPRTNGDGEAEGEGGEGDDNWEGEEERETVVSKKAVDRAEDFYLFVRDTQMLWPDLHACECVSEWASEWVSAWTSWGGRGAGTEIG